MNDDEARRRLTDARVARLATVDRHGRPHLVPICFVFDGRRLFSVVDDKPKRSPRLKRLDNVTANPAVEIIVDHYEDDWTAVWWVRVSGSAHVVHEGVERDAAVALLAAKYEPYRVRQPVGPVLVVEVEHIRHWDGVPRG
jgi:PPOX class probable F420-dependent enzyme